ncbi:MAG: hypothetical protein JWR10_3596, partial [Rubritepida sp.]|nr:hypothetical protein [Rubritepida sp.]
MRRPAWCGGPRWRNYEAMQRLWISAAGVSGLLAVGLSAIAAHAELDARA